MFSISEKQADDHPTEVLTSDNLLVVNDNHSLKILPSENIEAASCNLEHQLNDAELLRENSGIRLELNHYLEYSIKCINLTINDNLFSFR